MLQRTCLCLYRVVLHSVQFVIFLSLSCLSNYSELAVFVPILFLFFLLLYLTYFTSQFWWWASSFCGVIGRLLAASLWHCNFIALYAFHVISLGSVGVRGAFHHERIVSQKEAQNDNIKRKRLNNKTGNTE